MSDLRKKGEVPLSPKDKHQRNIGTGNYNRFSALTAPEARLRLNSKRKLDEDNLPAPPKTPRLDANAVFEQLKGTEELAVEMRKAIKDALAFADNAYSAKDEGIGAAFFNLARAVELLISNQDKLVSVVVDALGVLGKPNPVPYSSVTAPNSERGGKSSSAAPPQTLSYSGRNQSEEGKAGN